ncbi:HlyD family efflux transporter periplasmic adaptor subunit [Devosia rhodophyticola]|uniref:HlyD family efflux transporter periplasmic adaptor subunit n=1 Tax=Devosia rhodophyticola TaxID=3026423 RepID=A0ABY7YTG9_9HYPH|nr:HlyD family efflux transporter periplasmic adaptor subunit [Devosia rhodophyticola]WDR04668.1 HlyD family efflux transporter periplasmic adaptor subunit [Devosia rhodophyticola]
MIGAAVVVGGGLTAVFWPRPTMVDMGVVKRGEMMVTIDQDGRTRVKDAYIVSTPVAGRLQRVEVQPGDSVVKNETIVAHMLPINPVAMDIRTREQARAAVTVAQAALRVARAGLNAAIANRDYAESSLSRTQQLVDRNAASETTLERAQQSFRVAMADVETAEAEISQREADVANAQAQLIGFSETGLSASVDASGSTDIPLYAPADGLILRVIQQSETTLPAGAPIMEIGNTSNDLEIVVDLLSTDAVQVKVGDRVIVDDWGGDTTLSGEVVRIDPFGVTKFSALGVEEQRVNAVLRFTEPSSDYDGLGHGFRIETRIVVWEKNDALIVPSAALFRSGDGWSTFVVSEGSARLTPVSIGHNNGIEAEVLSDTLSEDQQVILYPASGLNDGANVSKREIE